MKEEKQLVEELKKLSESEAMLVRQLSNAREASEQSACAKEGYEEEAADGTKNLHALLRQQRDLDRGIACLQRDLVDADNTLNLRKRQKRVPAHARAHLFLQLIIGHHQARQWMTTLRECAETCNEKQVNGKRMAAFIA